MDRWVDHLEALAEEVLPEPVHRYIRQGAREGISAAEARAAWERFRFRPSVLRDVTAVDCSARLLGAPVSSPIAIAPTTLQRAVHTEGEVAMARAAAACGTVLVVSSNAGSTFADIGGTGVSWWLQIYLPADRLLCKPLVDSAVAAGASAIVLTADTPVVGTKYDAGAETIWDLAAPEWVRVNFPPGYGAEPGHEKAMDLGPQDVDWLRSTSGLPVVVKGVVRGDDARRCVDAGAAAVWVSNHGGRQLDRTLAAPDALAEVVDAVEGGAEVYVDGGITNGRDAVAALALGATGVFLGRAPLYALAVEGEPGVRRLLEELRDDLVETMRLCGRSRVDLVARDLLG